MSEAVSKRCNKSAAAYLIISVLLSAWLGYSVGTREGLGAIVSLSAQQADERVSIRRHYAAQMNAERKRYEILDEQYKALAKARGE